MTCQSCQKDIPRKQLCQKERLSGKATCQNCREKHNTNVCCKCHKRKHLLHFPGFNQSHFVGQTNQGQILEKEAKDEKLTCDACIRQPQNQNTCPRCQMPRPPGALKSITRSNICPICEKRECARILSLPRPRAVCGLVVKEKEAFSAWQWDDRQYCSFSIQTEDLEQVLKPIKCLECFPEIEEEEERIWAEVKRSFAKQRHQGLEFYRFLPNLQWQETASQWQETANPADLVGTYDIIFRYGYGECEQEESRKITGSSLVLKKKTSKEDDSDSEDDFGYYDNEEDSEDEDDSDDDDDDTKDDSNDDDDEDAKNDSFLLKGTLKFDERYSTEETALVLDSDLTITQRKSTSSNSSGSLGYWQGEFDANFIDFELQGMFQPYGEPAETYVKVLKERTALPWIPNKYTAYAREWTKHGLEKYIVPQFNTIQEAEQLMEQYENGYGSADWLCVHKGVTLEIAKHIHDYHASTWKPCPVFFLEPGDLVIHVVWSSSGGYGSYIVARKQQQAEEA